MHIPDGYLSPSTCACLYGASAPFWYVSLKRIRTELSSRTVPLLSVFSAFSFVIMMFNLPLPGGTTGHAVGMAAASIVLGPFVSILAISIALLIQALFFGDGGITAYGANCFNMAIVGSFSAFAIYRAVAGKSELVSPRRVLAAGLAGYGAINLSAFFAAIEFGIQPIYFHDASGAPLYAPYPLSIAIPAMMIGHLTIAGFAELAISSGLVRYLQTSDPELLRATAPDAPGSPNPKARRGAPQALWAALAVLLLLTPLGILAAGSAWGEWSPQEVGSPRGMLRLHSLWQAPFAGYSIESFKNSSAGYLLSALLGILLILFAASLIHRTFGHVHRRSSFVETSITHLVTALQRAFFAEESALSPGFLQSLDPRVKLVAFAALAIATLATHRLLVLVALVAFSVLLALLSRLPLLHLLLRAWTAVLAFTGAVALPAVFLTPGHVIYRVPLFDWSITAQGVHAAAFLLLRAETTATLALLLIASTLWAQLIRALRAFRIPTTAVILIAMAYRYIFVFLQTAQSMLESRQTKLVGPLSPADGRRLAAASAGVLLDKSLQLSSEVHTAMQARGFRGEVHLLEEPSLSVVACTQLAVVLLLSAALVLVVR